MGPARRTDRRTFAVSESDAATLQTQEAEGQRKTASTPQVTRQMQPILGDHSRRWVGHASVPRGYQARLPAAGPLGQAVGRRGCSVAVTAAHGLTPGIPEHSIRPLQRSWRQSAERMQQCDRTRSWRPKGQVDLLRARTEALDTKINALRTDHREAIRGLRTDLFDASPRTGTSRTGCSGAWIGAKGGRSQRRGRRGQQPGLSGPPHAALDHYWVDGTLVALTALPVAVSFRLRGQARPKIIEPVHP